MKLIEDPFYDEDGVLIDEDGCGPDLLFTDEDLELELDEIRDQFSPYITINS